MLQNGEDQMSFRNKLHMYLPDDPKPEGGGNGGDGAANSGAGAPQNDAGGSNGTGGGNDAPPANSSPQNGNQPPNPGNADPSDISALPEGWQKHIRDLRGENGTRRQNEASLTADRDKYKAFYDQVLGVVNPEENKDPAQLAKDVQTEREQRQESDRKLAIYRLAGQHGADADALLDSASFLTDVRQLDTNSSDFSTQMGEKIKGAVEQNGRLKARSSGGNQQRNSAPGSSGSTEFPGGAGNGQQLTRDDLKNMSPEQVEKARVDGRLKTLLGG